MVRLKLFIELQYEIIGEVSDFIFNIHAAQTPRQSLVSENLQVSQPVAVALFADSCGRQGCDPIRPISAIPDTLSPLAATAASV